MSLFLNGWRINFQDFRYSGLLLKQTIYIFLYKCYRNVKLKYIHVFLQLLWKMLFLYLQGHWDLWGKGSIRRVQEAHADCQCPFAFRHAGRVLVQQGVLQPARSKQVSSRALGSVQYFCWTDPDPEGVWIRIQSGSETMVSSSVSDPFFMRIRIQPFLFNLPQILNIFFVLLVCLLLNMVD